MPYRLKPGQETFEIMGGPDEGKQFKRGAVYDSIPEGYADRFEEIKTDGRGLKAEGKGPFLFKKKAEPPAATPLMDAEETDKKGE